MYLHGKKEGIVDQASACWSEKELEILKDKYTLLSNCLDQAVAERLILVNPAQGCKLPKLEKKEMRILPQEKIGMYLAEAERRGLLAAFYLELTTGLRRGELLALLWTDLDTEVRTISVTKQVNRIKSCPVLFRPFQPFSRVGQLVGWAEAPKINIVRKLRKAEKTRRNNTVSAGQYVSLTKKMQPTKRP